MPVMASAMESFGKPGWPDFKPLLMYRMRNTDEYTITVRTCEEQEMIATDIPFCSLEQVLRNIEKRLKKGISRPENKKASGMGAFSYNWMYLS